MGYFKALGAALFKEDDAGNTLFYPWGILGRGIILDTEERKDQILLFISRYYLITFVLIFCLQFLILIAHVDIIRVSLLFGVLILMMTVWYVTRIRALTSELPRTSIRMTMSNGWEATARNLPRSVIAGGFIAMIVLIGLALAAMIMLEGALRWAGAFLLLVGIFGTYAYTRMLGFANTGEKAPRRTFVRPSIPKEPNDNPPDAMTWNFRNSLIVLSVLCVTIAIVYYSYADSKKGYDERMARYNEMTTEEMANYLSEVNSAPEQLDPITRHTGTECNGTTIYFHRELSDGLLSDMVVDTDDIDGEKARMTQQLRREMCGMPTWDLFYEKGGSVIYSYRLTTQDKELFLFNVFIDQEFCL